MKKFILSIVMCMVALVSNAVVKNDIKGVWVDKHVKMTISNKTLKIDAYEDPQNKIHIEPEIYTYDVNGDTLVLHRNNEPYNDILYMNILCIDHNTITYCYTDYPNEIFTLYRIKKK